MAEKHYKPEEIVASLRQVDVLISQDQANRGRNPPDRKERGDVFGGARSLEG